MNEIKFQKTIIKIFLIPATLIGIACIGKKTITAVDGNSVLPDNQKHSVTLQLKSHLNDSLIIEFSNNTEKSVYLAYEFTDENKSDAVTTYRLLCEERDGKFKDYGPTSHIVPVLDSLGKGESFQFVVTLPHQTQTSKNCKVIKLYYEDGKIVDLINNKISNLNETEINLIEKAKKFVELSIPVSSNTE